MKGYIRIIGVIAIAALMAVLSAPLSAKSPHNSRVGSESARYVVTFEQPSVVTHLVQERNRAGVDAADTGSSGGGGPRDGVSGLHEAGSLQQRRRRDASPTSTALLQHRSQAPPPINGQTGSAVQVS